MISSGKPKRCQVAMGISITTPQETKPIAR